MLTRSISIFTVIFDLIAGVLLGYTVLVNTNDITAAVVTLILSSIAAQVLLGAYKEKKAFGKNLDFFKEIHTLINPRNLCPAFLDDVKEHIRVSVGPESLIIEERDAFSVDGCTTDWDKYSELLSSSLKRSGAAFMATCLLTPAEFELEKFNSYKICQELHLRMWFFMIGRRFRIVVADKQKLLSSLNDQALRKKTEDFFCWHKKYHITLYFIPIDKYVGLLEHYGLKLNDFVCFSNSTTKTSWVVGGQADFDEYGDMYNHGLHLYVYDDHARVNKYIAFVKSSKSDDCSKKIRSVKELNVWLTN